MDIKIDFSKEPFRSSSTGRLAAWRQRDDKIYCKWHPKIHPDNEEKIKLKEGSTTKKEKNTELTSTFMYCPKCFAINK